MRSWLTGRTTDARSRDRRGQTNLDFVVGVSLFIVAVIFVWLFLPNLFAPFAGDDVHSDGVAAERAANTLANDLPSNGSDMAHVDQDCLVAFFEGPRNDAGCGFDNSTTLAERVGLRANTPLNITIQGDVDGDGNKSTLCWTGEPGGISSQYGLNVPMGGLNETGPPCVSPHSGKFPLTAGGQPGSNTQTNVARRAVIIDGQRATIVVRTW